MDNIFGEFDLRRAAVEGIEEAVAWHTVGLIADDGRTIGTASAVRWAGRAVLLTARHVVEDSLGERLWFFPRPPGALERHEVGEIADGAPIPILPRLEIPLRRALLCPDADLAVLEVEPEAEAMENVPFSTSSKHREARKVVPWSSFRAILLLWAELWRAVHWQLSEEPKYGKFNHMLRWMDTTLGGRSCSTTLTTQMASHLAGLAAPECGLGRVGLLYGIPISILVV
jgi:hypothetical protein